MSTDKKTGSYKFVNPYNFVPLFGKRAYAEGAQEKGGYTGVINYSVLTKTPLFIPNTSNDNAFHIKIKENQENQEKKGKKQEHKSYEFFSYTDLSDCKEALKEPDYMPVIPGSEMRGMLRSYYEILTNSCMSSVDDTATLNKRTNETYKAGLIKKGGAGTYDLYCAVDCLMRTEGENSLKDDWAADNEHYKRKCYVQNDLKEGQKVYFEYVERMVQKNGKAIKPLAKCVSIEEPGEGELIPGYVIKGEDGPQMNDNQLKQQKHCCHIFTEDASHKKPYRKDISLSTLQQAIKAYKDNGEHPYKEYEEQLKNFMENGEVGEFFPVYYSEVEMHLMLSPACITREIYGRKLREMLGTYASCTNEDSLCPACTLFGTIGSGFARTSRIRVADLVCAEPEGKECYEQPVTLAPLSSPKLNNMEFYLKRPKDAWFWTYDYYIDDKGNLYENHEGINGRKFYWHQLDMKLENQEATNLNMTIRPLKKNITFKGRLYFRNLTKTELDQLIYLLKAGDEENELRKKTHGHKLGGGKPLGLGSIAVSVDRVMIRCYEKDAVNHIVQRKESTYDGYSVPKFEKNILHDFEIMTNFNAVKDKNISYPLTGKQDKDGNMNIFDWFTNNHKAYRIKNGVKERLKMPNSRKQMVYAEYMEPMKAELVSTGFLENSVEANSGHQNNGQRLTGLSNGKKVINAQVTGTDSYGNVYIKEIADPSQKGRIGVKFLEGQSPKKGDTIKVSFYKTNDKGINLYNIIV